MPAELLEPSSSVREFLGLRLIATLATSNDDGTILLTPVWYLYEAGYLYLPTGSTSRKVRNVRARPSVTVLVDQRRPESHRWASATGTAEILDGERARSINERVRRRYVNAAGEETYGRMIAGFDDVTLVVTPDHWRSWRPAALERLAAEHGLPDDGVASWFEPWDS